MRQLLLDAYRDVVRDVVYCKEAAERHGVNRGQLWKICKTFVIAKPIWRPTAFDEFEEFVKRKLDIVIDDLENSMLVEEAVADANEIINEKPLKKKRISEKGKKRPLENANVVVPAKRPRGRPRKNAA